MARQEHERENLLRDATAFTERIEFAPRDPVPAGRKGVFIGFRSDGRASFYFGDDPVYHFTPAGQLRRAFVASRLIKIEGEELVAMRRVREAGQVQLVSRPLRGRPLQEFRETLREHLHQLAEDLQNDCLESVGQVPADADIASRAVGWLQRWASGR